ncbi:phosphotransferase [Gammaproteobacteria bacterium]|nr:phosphotransferase [Gammaproteobacteria bacterium]
MTSAKITLNDVIEREALKIVYQYEFSEKATVSLLSESENKVYLIDDPAMSEKYVLRVNSGRLAYHNPLSIASEMMWLQALYDDTDIVVPKVLAARDGSLVQTMTAADLDKPRHASVYSFVSGSEPSETELIAGFKRLGKIAARMHLHAKTWTPPANFNRHTWSPDTILDDGQNWGKWQKGVAIEGESLKLLTRLDQLVRRRLAALPTETESFGLIHADLRLANILVEGDRTAIIDFDDCGYCWFLYELAGALSFLEERPDANDLVASWLEGYRKVNDIPAVIEAEIPTLIMLRRLQLIGWVGYQQQHLEFAREIGLQFTLDTCRLAEDYFRSFA